MTPAPPPHHWFESRYPTILPVAIIAIVLATVLCTAAARRLGTGRGVAWLLMASLGFILALTIAPSRQALTVGVTGPVASLIGPTFAPEELAGRKVVALFDRAEARDFADVFELSEHYSRDALLAHGS